MRYRPMDTDPADPRLGRFIPDDWRHVERYPLTALAADELPTRVPVVIGVNWYTEFDKPEKDAVSGEFFVAKKGAKSLTRIRGGHCVCLEPGGDPDTDGRQKFYDQGREGACVGFGWSRAMSIFNSDLYAARWLWDTAKKRDQWPETNPGDDNGTSVRAAAEALVELGHVTWSDMYVDDDWHKREKYTPDVNKGLKVFRWAKNVEDVHAVLGNERADKLGAVPFLNSWGMGYPHRTYMPDDVLARLLEEEGEIAVPTDR
ncbi:hypothetical protein SAMN05421504_103439 [Amycolatopsis xylanica]|uniref:Uncharacterized protein n=1 Tax=Amycolatopsis xylanica TaxID=589385 RepID=A0A1H3DLA3_9PSEU|nr:hypothetical protein [Amycolatopsis xylanica]SDX67292.1 hypothetical protein SAMN05421504_103439 [Amycolatopsis xylanica]